MRTLRSHGRHLSKFPFTFRRPETLDTAFCCNLFAALATTKTVTFGLTHYINFSSGDNFPYSLE
jgi:hypothetical protein